MSVVFKADDSVIRYATEDDYDDVLAINKNVFDGLDYMTDMYHSYIRDPRSKAYVLLRGEKIVSFFFWTIIDEGKTIVLRGGRSKEDVQQTGLSRFIDGKEIQMAEDEFLKRKVPLCEGLHGLRDGLRINKNVENVAGMVRLDVTDTKKKQAIERDYDLVYIQINLHFTTKKLSPTHTTANSPLPLVEPNRIWEVLKTHAHLFKSYLFVDFLPYKPIEANFKILAENIKPVTFVSNDGKSISLGTYYYNRNNFIYHFVYYGTQLSFIESHIDSHLNLINSKRSCTDKELHFMINYEVTLGDHSGLDNLFPRWGIRKCREIPKHVMVQVLKNFSEHKQILSQL